MDQNLLGRQYGGALMAAIASGLIWGIALILFMIGCAKAARKVLARWQW